MAWQLTPAEIRGGCSSRAGMKALQIMSQQPRKEHAVIWAGQDVLWWKISEEHESKEVQEIRYEGSYPILEKKMDIEKTNQIKTKHYYRHSAQT